MFGDTTYNRSTRNEVDAMANETNTIEVAFMSDFWNDIFQLFK